MLLPGSPAHYRVSQEFDDLDDLELEHLVFQAKDRRDDAVWILPLLAVIGAWVLVMGPVLSLVWMLLGSMTATGGGGAGGTSGGFDPTSLAGVLAIGLVCAIGIGLSVVVWVWVRRWLIIRSMRHIIRKASCPYCGFDLRGLPVTDYRLVRCPECGESINLADHGLTKRDLSLD